MSDGKQPEGRRRAGRESAAARGVLAAIVVASVVLALVWMFLVPFFQEPDENAHFDYAYALYSAGRPYRVVRARCGAMTEVTPAARYLERSSDFYGLRLMSTARAPLGYGSRAFYRALDAAAPVRDARIPAAGSAVPCVMTTYPAGYYALAAGAMALAGFATHHSLVAEFFGARALGIVCLAAALPLAFRVLRASGAAADVALLGTAAIGFFPLTSWVAASVQPDDLTFVLVTLALGCALRSRQRPFDVAAAAGLGLALALLFFVKPLYGATVYAACALGLLAAVPRGVPERQHRAPCAVFICVVPLVALAATRFASPAAIIFGHHGSPTAIEPQALGAEAALPASAAYAALAFRNAFAGGPSFEGFWDSFGWAQNSFFSPAAARADMNAALVCASLAVGLCFVGRRFDVLRRVAVLAVRRSRSAAVRLLCTDVVLNAYLFWTALLLVVAGAARGSWWPQGRYWLPVMAPLVVVLVRDVPRVLPHRLRASAGTALAATLLLYAVGSAPFALASARARYYATPQATAARVTVVSVAGAGFFGQAHATAHRLIVARGENVALAGIAFRATDGEPIAGVAVGVDGHAPQMLQYGFVVPTGVAPMPIGFHGTLRTGNLEPGAHRLIVSSYLADGRVDRWRNEIALDVAP